MANLWLEALQTPSKVFKNTAQKNNIHDVTFYCCQRNDKTIARMLYDHSTDSDETEIWQWSILQETVDSLSTILNNRLKRTK